MHPVSVLASEVPAVGAAVGRVFGDVGPAAPVALEEGVPVRLPPAVVAERAAVGGVLGGVHPVAAVALQDPVVLGGVAHVPAVGAAVGLVFGDVEPAAAVAFEEIHGIEEGLRETYRIPCYLCGMEKRGFPSSVRSFIGLAGVLASSRREIRAPVESPVRPRPLDEHPSAYGADHRQIRRSCILL